MDAVRHSSEQQRQKLSGRVEEVEAEYRLLSEKLERTELLLTAATSDEALQKALAEARDATERRLEETRMELSDVKSKWCSQVVSLETQLGRLSIQAGEEGAERRRAEQQLKEITERLPVVTAERDEALSQLAKVAKHHKLIQCADSSSSDEIDLLLV